MGSTETPPKFSPVGLHPMDETTARAIATWRYEPPYEVYSLDTGDPDELVDCFLDPVNAYYSIVDRGGCLAAYCCFGPDARVPGGDYDRPALDVGLGMHPNLTGQGLGHAFVHAVLRFAQQEFASSEFRVTVAEFNRRALRVWKAAGFRQVQRFERVPGGMPDGMLFIILTKRGQ